MSTGAILALDQGTSSTKGLLIEGGRVIARAARSLRTLRPRPDWAEQDGEAIWRTVTEVIEELVAAGRPVAGVAITNQRETIGVWDEAGRALAPFVLWQCRRSSAICDTLKPAEREISERSGLPVDPMFSASKLAWLLDHVSDARALATQGRLRAGTVDSWLLWKLTAGAVHATDHSNAARTQLMNLASLAWDPDLGALFGVPLSILPRILPSAHAFGNVASGVTALPSGVPILALIGDSHAALAGHGFDEPGPVKATCGTGSSLMTLTPKPVASRHGLSTTIGWSTPWATRYALEGNIVVSGQALTFAARMLGLKDETALFALAAFAPDSGGVAFVPAMSGLGAPHWCDQARGLICGMTLSMGPEHVARAAIEGVALQIRDVVEAMDGDLGQAPQALSIDGGAADNDVLAQTLADLADVPVLRPREQNLSALGAARLAAGALGEAVVTIEAGDRFEPRMPHEQRERIIAAWKDALDRTKS